MILCTFSILFSFINRLNSSVGKREVFKFNLIVISCTTLLQIIIYPFKYYAYLLYYRSKNIVSRDSVYLGPSFMYPYVLYLVLIAIHPNILTMDLQFTFKDFTSDSTLVYKINDILEFFQLFKMIIVFNIILMNTKWQSDKSTRIC